MGNCVDMLRTLWKFKSKTYWQIVIVFVIFSISVSVSDGGHDNDLVFDEQTAGAIVSHSKKSQNYKSTTTSHLAYEDSSPVENPENAFNHDALLQNISYHRTSVKTKKHKPDQNFFNKEQLWWDNNHKMTKSVLRSDISYDHRRGRRQIQQNQSFDYNDDEDIGISSGDAIEGSADVPSIPVYFRCSLAVKIPFTEELRQKDSQVHRLTKRDIRSSLERLYEPIPGEKSITILRFEPMQDPFLTLVVFDIGTKDFQDEEALNSVLQDQIQVGALDRIPLSPEGFSLKLVGGNTNVTSASVCGPLELSCRNGECVPIASRCDGKIQCRDGSDEIDCDFGTEVPIPVIISVPQEDKCRADTTVTCKDGTIICEVQWCDGNPDCPEKDDELNCPDSACDALLHFQCDNGHCIEKKMYCDGTNNCQDGSDETKCAGLCASHEFQCADRSCIPDQLKCNSYFDCAGGEDERGCESRPVPCRSDQFRCNDGKCLNIYQRCDRARDCASGEDEIGCSIPACRSDQFRCNDGKCLNASQRCDRKSDCSYGEDEAGCRECAEWSCWSGECIRNEDRCDGQFDCSDGSDEIDCQACASHQFRCPEGTCINNAQKCDGRRDCFDGSDEENCRRPTSPSTSSGGLQLKTYPSQQTIKAGLEVVFQCRDEGPLRIQVRWKRAKNLPLPPRSRMANGRLEIPEIQLEHSGTYICEAVGYSESTPGATASVYLHVDQTEVSTAPPHIVCRSHEATCMNGQCIAKDQVCDGDYDCSDGSDELRCNSLGCEPNEFACDNKRCVPKPWRCDSDNDCGDNTDERNCAATPGSLCHFYEFQCRTGDQCIPKSFHCDREIDCQDRSDELGCSSPTIQTSPPPMVEVAIGASFTISCSAVGVPSPEIVWRLNWGHIPPKCKMSTVNNTGTLWCPNTQLSDQGAYSCEAINNLGATFAVPDAIVVVQISISVCQAGTFNSLATTVNDCIQCFCFGIATFCNSATDIYIAQIPPQSDQFQLVAVEETDSERTNVLRILSRKYLIPRFSGEIQALIHDLQYERSSHDYMPYFGLSSSHHGNQLRSYGGYLKYGINYEGSGQYIHGADVILKGNGKTLYHIGHQSLAPGRDNTVSVRFWYGEWYKQLGGRPGGDISVSDGEVASREEIMFTLQNVDNILIRAQYMTGVLLNTTLSNVRLDTGIASNTGQGLAVFVEQCRCPFGYTGLSCEECAPGYRNIPSQPWLGRCIPDEPVTICPQGYYREGRNCVSCPCPETNAPRKFGSSCRKDSDGTIECVCERGYRGRQCTECEVGYTQSSQWPYNCTPATSCDAAGSLSLTPDPFTGRCQCKDFTSGSLCSRCQTNTFYIDEANQYGCISCFCMGVTNQCTSSSWYRMHVSAVFTTSRLGFGLVDQSQSDTVSDGVVPNLQNRELVFKEFHSLNPEVYYWLLPPLFLGNKLTSYGGNLNYTVRYVPAHGGQSSKNNAPDVEINGNEIRLLYFNRDPVPPNRPHEVSVPFLEQHWQRQDGLPTNREHLLMALANLDSILIKATYTTNSQEVGLSNVRMERAEERNNGQSRAFAVEQCVCPAGYRGLSCETCDIGFTRTLTGLYLGLCEPCSCNGHSEHCDPETGVCLNCRDHTTGESCQECIAGYSGDASQGTSRDCIARRQPTCNCDPRGSLSSVCIGGSCQCKTNVEGPECNICRRSSFGLRADRPQGCLQCYCFGQSSECSSAKLYRTQIPMQILDSNHGFSLTDNNRVDHITEGFTLDVEDNEISYSYPSTGVNSDRLFWSLPSLFIGKKVETYGGRLSITQRYVAASDGDTIRDTDVVLIGNGATLYFINPTIPREGQTMTYTVPLTESGWSHLSGGGSKSASREDFLLVLSSLENILIRATYNTRMEDTFLSNVIMDTAVPQFTGQSEVFDVEHCRCPHGYHGFSCEQCSTGYYRDPTDRNVGYLGACKKCPCNNKEESCTFEVTGVVCHCLPGYTGTSCNNEKESLPTVLDRPAVGIPTISPANPEVRVGETVRVACQISTGRVLSVEWSRTGAIMPLNSVQSEGLLTIYNTQPDDSGIYTCIVTGVEGTTRQAQTRITIVQYGSVPYVSIEPERQTISQGETAELRCITTGEPKPTVTWSKVRDEFTSNVQVAGEVLRIVSTTVQDRGVYVCRGVNSGGTAEASAILEIERREPPTVELYPGVQQAIVQGGSALFQCRVTGGVPTPRLRWTRVDGQPLPVSAIKAEGGVIRFHRVGKDAEGQYACLAENEAGSTSAIAILVVQGVPIISVSPSTLMRAHSGERIRMECKATGDPSPTVSWRRLHAGSYDGPALPALNTPHTAIYEIVRVTKSDEGSYICVGRNAAGISEERVQLLVDDNLDISDNEVIAISPPSHEERDDFTVNVGGRAELRCIVQLGDNDVYVTWHRVDGGKLPDSHTIQDGVFTIYNAQAQDQGEYICTGIARQTGSILFEASTRLAVRAPPRIQLQPVRQIVRPGDYVDITCSATGDQPISLLWNKVSGHLPPSVSVNRGNLHFQGIAVSDAGRYICKAENAVGTSEAVAEVVVNDVPVVSTLQRDQKVAVGTLAEMQCHLSTTSLARILWTKDGSTLPRNAQVLGTVLKINNVQLQDAGRYICEARTDAGVSSDYINLQVESIPNVYLRITPSRDLVYTGDSITVRCEAFGDPRAQITWAKVTGSFAYNVQNLGNILRISQIGQENGGLYRCNARTAIGTLQEDYVLAIQTKPDFVLDQAVETRTAPTGFTVVMDCRTDLESPVHFSWGKRGGVLSRSTLIEGATLTIPDVSWQEAGTYICTARNQQHSIDIPTILVVTKVLPYFSQSPTSYVSLPTLPDAYIQFTIEITFKPDTNNGLILYNGQHPDGTGDFIVFGMNEGHAELRFDVGSGPAILRSLSPLKLGSWHTVKLTRNKKDGVLLVNNDPEVSGTAAGRFQGLDLVEPLYVGGVPQFGNVHKLAAQTQGFQGCISHLVLSGVEQDLMIANSLGVVPCETCTTNPCANGGVCQEAPLATGYSCICPSGFSGLNCDKVGETCYQDACGTGKCSNSRNGFKCLCPFGKSGDHCERDITIYEPAFSDEAYVAYPTPKALKRLRLALRFKPVDLKDSVLVFCSQNEDGHGDYTAILIKDKKVEFIFDSGSGPAVLRSTNDLVAGEWMKVIADRNMRDGTLTVGSEEEVKGKSPGTHRGLNLRTPLFVGGYDQQKIKLPVGIGVSKGFQGCISDIEVSDQEVNVIESVVESVNVEDCSNGSPCQRHPCENGGTCQQISSTNYLCKCLQGWLGERCEKQSDVCQVAQPCVNGGKCVADGGQHRCVCTKGFAGNICQDNVVFSEEILVGGDGYVELSRDLLPHVSTTEKEIIEIEFSTTHRNGVLLWQGQEPHEDGNEQDYLTLSLVDGTLEFSYELGSGPAMITMPTLVTDGKRHRVVIQRTAREGSIELDGIYHEMGESPGILQMLNTKGNIYLGGLPDVGKMTAGKYSENFRGCIHSIQVQNSGIIDLYNKSVSTVNVRPCPSKSLDYDDGFNFLEGRYST